MTMHDYDDDDEEGGGGGEVSRTEARREEGVCGRSTAGLGLSAHCAGVDVTPRLPGYQAEGCRRQWH